MAQHWSRFVAITERQARVLDKMAAANELDSGMSILMKLSGVSRSKVGKLDSATIQTLVDEAFETYGR